MTSQIVGYYVHHQGNGHRDRYAKIAAVASADLVALSQRPICGGRLLSSDVPDRVEDPTAGDVLHWAPIDRHDGPRRLTELIGWMVDAQPRGVVVDVSVEVALATRLAGLPSVVVRQHGCRDDLPHRLAYKSARRLLAPFPSEVEHPGTPRWITRKTSYTGYIGWSTHEIDTTPDAPGPDDVVVVWGSGGGRLTDHQLGALVEAATPGRVIYLGEWTSEPVAGVEHRGRVEDVRPWLAHRPTVIAATGNNSIADAVHAGTALVTVPQSRPFDEQERHAEALDRIEAAAVVRADRMTTTTWRAAIDLARRRRSTLAGLADPHSAWRAWEVIDEWLR